MINQEELNEPMHDYYLQPWNITSTSTYGISNTLYEGRMFYAKADYNTLNLIKYSFNGNDTMDIKVYIYKYVPGSVKSEVLDLTISNIPTNSNTLSISSFSLGITLEEGYFYRVNLIQAIGGWSGETLRINMGWFSYV